MRRAMFPLISAAALIASCTNYPPPYPPPPVGPPAPPPGASLAPADCFRAMDMRNHTIGDGRTLYVDVSGKGVYRIGMGGSCLAGAISTDPIITRRPPGTEIICRPIDLDLAISRHGFETACIPESIVRLTPAEVAALPPKLRP
jgi:hypothetical protein